MQKCDMASAEKSKTKELTCMARCNPFASSVAQIAPCMPWHIAMSQHIAASHTLWQRTLHVAHCQIAQRKLQHIAQTSSTRRHIRLLTFHRYVSHTSSTLWTSETHRVSATLEAHPALLGPISDFMNQLKVISNAPTTTSQLPTHRFQESLLVVNDIVRLGTGLMRHLSASVLRKDGHLGRHFGGRNGSEDLFKSAAIIKNKTIIISTLRTSSTLRTVTARI